MRAVSKTLQHPTFRPAVSWAAGAASVVVFFWCILRSARSYRPTLGVLSWLIDGLVAAGRAWASIVDSHSSALIVTFLVLGAVSLALPDVRRALVLRNLVVAMIASLLALVSMVKMMEKEYGLAVSLAIIAGVVLVAGARNLDARDLATDREWPIWVPLGVAVLLRFWSLAEVPRGFAQHAVVHLQLSRRFAEALRESISTFDIGPISDLMPYLREQHGPLSMVDGIGLFIFGVGMVEARMTQAVLGCIAVAVAYGLGKTIGGPRLGFLFSFLLAVSPWHLAFSRYGDGEHVVPTLQVLLSMLLLVRAIRFGRARDYVLCGLVVGLSWYFYATNQVVPIIVAVFLVYKVVTARGYWKRDWTKLVLLAAAVMVVSYPHLGAHLERGDTWLARSPSLEFRPNAVVGSWPMSEAATQLFHQVNDPWYVRPGGGLGWATQTLVIVGLIVCLAGFFVRRRRDASVLLILWLTLAFLPALLSTPHFRRLLLVLVAALLLSSMALVRALDLFERGGLPKKVVAALMIGVCVVFTATGAHVYFEMVRIPESNHHTDHTSLARFVGQNMTSSFVYVYTPFDDYRQEVEEYVGFIAHRQIAALRIQGESEDEHFQMLMPGDLQDAVEFIRTGGREVTVVAHDSAEWTAEGLGGLKSMLDVDSCQTHRDGELTIWQCNDGVRRRPDNGHQGTETDEE